MLSKEVNIDVTEMQPEPPTKRCKRKLTNAMQPVDLDPDVQMQSKQPPTKRRKRKPINLIQPGNLDSEVDDHYTSETIEQNIDKKSGNFKKNELMVRFRSLITDILDGSDLSDDHMSAGSQLLHLQFPHFQGFCFPHFDQISGYACHSYLQILHTGSHHWVAVEIISSAKYTYMTAYISNNLHIIL